VNLVLVDATGALLGALPPLPVEQPWWQETDEIVAAARARDGVELQVLRVLSGTGDFRPAAGGEVTYLAEVNGTPPVGLAPVDVDLSPQPHRLPWAQPGGPAASVGWGTAALAALGTPGASATQMRSWNLSAVWRFDAAGSPVAWLKQVPPFFAHEAAVLSLVGGVAPGLVPPLLATGDDGRMLLAHVPGEDGYTAGAEHCAQVAIVWHPVQAHFIGGAPPGVPVRPLEADPFAEVAEPYYDHIDGLADLIGSVPGRLAAIEACGLPDTLVHGDLHSGNTRVGAGQPVILDWGDSSISHPALDILTLTTRLDPVDAKALLAAWALRWQITVPGSDPARAVELMRPIAQLRGAVTYRDFVAAIEPAEHVYHHADIAAALRDAVAATVT
jgi:hypothetical protein